MPHVSSKLIPKTLKNLQGKVSKYSKKYIHVHTQGNTCILSQFMFRYIKCKLK